MYCFFYVILCNCAISYGEYFIKSEIGPIFLHYKFYNLTNDVFPFDLTIDLLLSRVSGTFLYSMDSNDNQLIININDADVPTLDIEFSKNHNYLSLSKLCSLGESKYVRLKLRIQMREELYIQCNGGSLEAFKYERTKQINKDYPIPKFNKTDKLDAQLWLVNTPGVDGLYPNGAQLSGCIFDVFYENQRLKMETHNTGDQCKKTCTNDTCGDVKCLESYNGQPICNCTDSFKNGDYCKDELHKGYYEMKSDNRIQVKAIKIVFQNASLDIFTLNNNKTAIRISSEQSKLYFILNCSREDDIEIKGKISDAYIKADGHIVIFEFHENIMLTKYRSKNSKIWKNISINHNHDLSREVFTSLKMNSDDTVDMSFKNDFKEMRWNQLNYVGTNGNGTGKSSTLTINRNSRTAPKNESKVIQVTQVPSQQQCVSIINEVKNVRPVDIATIVILVIILVLMIIISLTKFIMWKKELKKKIENGYRLKKKKENGYRFTGNTSDPLVQEQEKV